jgi:hypothetical protein
MVCTSGVQTVGMHGGIVAQDETAGAERDCRRTAGGKERIRRQTLERLFRMSSYRDRSQPPDPAGRGQAFSC